jgi:hypothetical protein
MQEVPEFVANLCKALCQKAGQHTEIAIWAPKDASKELSITVRSGAMMAKVWTSFAIDGTRPKTDRELHFLLLNNALRKDRNIWHLARLRYEGANPSNMIRLATDRMMLLIKLADQRSACPEHERDYSCRLHYLFNTDQLVWTCAKQRCPWQFAVPSWISATVTEQTDKKRLRSMALDIPPDVIESPISIAQLSFQF